MTVRLYWFAASHPAMAVRKMLELKGIDFESVIVMPGTQRVHLRAAGFRGGTVPALRLDGRRIQGSRPIARALEEVQPEPRLFPRDHAALARVEEAERWGDEELQRMPRVLIRYGLVRHLALRRWLVEESGMPAAGVMARASAPSAWYYARVVGADEAAARGIVAQLPAMLDRVDGLLADGTLDPEQPNAAALQILSSVRALDAFADLHPHVADRPSVAAAQMLFPDYPGPVPPYLPDAWLSGLGAPAQARS